MSYLAFAAAALWAVHPLSTEAVTYVMGRADLLAAAGVLGGFLAYVRATEDPLRVHWPWLLVALLAETAGLFSKENGVVLIGIVVLYEWLIRPRRSYVGPSFSSGDHDRDAGAIAKPGRRKNNAKTAIEPQRGPSIAAIAGRVGLFLVPVVLFLLQRSTVIPASLPTEPLVDNPIAHAGFIQGRLTALAIAGRYIWLTLWPRTLSSDYSYSQIPLASGSIVDWLGWATVLALVAVAVLALMRARRNASAAVIAFGLGFAAVTFLPVSNLVFPTGTIMGERLMYLPLAGLALALVVSGRALAERMPSRLAPALLTVVVMLLAARTWTRNRDWQSNVSLWTSAVASAPNSFKTHKGLANALYEADPGNVDVKRVTAEADKSLAILDGLPDKDNVPEMYRRAAGYFMDLGDAMKKDPLTAFQADAAYARAIALAQRHIKVLSAVQAALSSGPAADQAMADANALLSMAYSRSGDSAHSLEASRRAMATQPLNPQGYRTLAAAFSLSGQLNEAAVALLTGFMVTGDTVLRQALFELYAGGLDTQHCASKHGPNGEVLNPDCPIVRQHLCTATSEAIRVQEQNGRADLVAQLKAMATRAYGCAGF